MFSSLSNSRKHKWHSISLGVFLIVILLVLLVPQPAHAGCGGWGWGIATLGVSCAIGWVGGAVGDAYGGIAIGLVTLVLELFGALLWQLVSLISHLFTFIIYDFNQQIGFYGNPFVVAGWSVVRDIMNWFFVVIFLVSAIATILDLQRYAARSVLPRLITVALLMNLSLFFTGFAVNISQQIAAIFVSSMTGVYDDIGQAFLSGSMIKDMRIPDISVALDFVGDSIGDQLINLVQKFFALVMLATFGFALGFLTIAIIVRNIMVWVLMIISPMAFVAAILPSTRSFWNQWLKKFGEYVAFLPIAVFFIWLGTWLMAFLDTISYGTADGVAYEVNSSAGGSSFITTVEEGMNFIMIVIFLFMSVIVTKMFAKEAGNIAAKSVGKAAIAGLGVGAFVGRRGGAVAGRTRLTERAGNFVGRIPLGGRVQRRLYGAQNAYDKRRGDKQDAKNLNNLTYDQILRKAKRSGTPTGVVTDEDAHTLLAAKEKGIDVIKDARWSKARATKAAKKLDVMGKGDDIVKLDPGLAARAHILPSQKLGAFKDVKDDPDGLAAAQNHMANMSSQEMAQLGTGVIDIKAADAGDEMAKAIVAGIHEGLESGNIDGRQLSAISKKAQSDKGAEQVADSMRTLLIRSQESGKLNERTVKQIQGNPILVQVFDLSDVTRGGTPPSDKTTAEKVADAKKKADVIAEDN